ncbi:MFS transporter [Amnibacterium sp.]|uniref:MFS transporter n=1 Tax=Amnibacterium sp. TaxID=1872496 RepID=UPI003F7CABF6
MGARAWWRIAPAVFALAWGGNQFSPLLLLYRQQEGYSQVEVDLLFAAYIVGIIPGFLIAGPLSDRFGRKPVLLVGTVLGVAASVILGLGATSVPALSIGRLVSGASVAAAMVVGSSWIKELSAALPAPVAARRASLTLTAGFGLGPAVAGVIAQWGPDPTELPYAVHVVLTLLAGAVLLTATETRRAGVLLVRVPRAVRGRFLGVVLPAAPWVFGCASVAFAVTPAALAGRLGGGAIGYATLLAVVALAFGAGVQPVAARIGRATGGRQLAVGLAIAVVGVLGAALVALVQQPLLGVPVAAVLGAAYGICLVSGLTEVQRTAPPEDLAALTAVYYSATYLGFTFPVLLAALTAIAPEPLLLALLALVAAGCLAVVLRNSARSST